MHFLKYFSSRFFPFTYLLVGLVSFHSCGAPRTVINVKLKEFACCFPISSVNSATWYSQFTFILFGWQESHIHSLMNVLRYCNLDESLQEEDSLVCHNGLERLYKTKELDYMSYIVLRMFENTEVSNFLCLKVATLWNLPVFDSLMLDWAIENLCYFNFWPLQNNLNC